MFRQTDAPLAGSGSAKLQAAQQRTNPNVPEIPANAWGPCSLSNERALVSSSGIEGCGMSKHARLELVSIK